jgi:hypothetical protein
MKAAATSSANRRSNDGFRLAKKCNPAALVPTFSLLPAPWARSNGTLVAVATGRHRDFTDAQVIALRVATG